MNPIFRWQFISLLIISFGSVPTCAQSSFLEEFRLQSDSPDYGEETQSLRTSFSSPELHEDPFRAKPVFQDDRSDSTARTLLDESARGQALLDDATKFAGFESDYSPELNNFDVPLVRHRTTCFQGTQAAYGYIPTSGSDGLGIQTFDLLGTFAVPIDGMDHVIAFTPFFRMDQLDANATLDVPDAIFETGVKSFWKKSVNERLTTIVLFTPSVRSDFQSSNDSFKLFGMALLQWKFIPDKLSMTGGAIYTGREDFPVLPMIGLLWTPSPVWKFDIQFPSPRFSRRILKDDQNSETWAYLSGVFGGNTWAIKRASGQDDQLTLRDLRLVLGVEHLLRENRGVFVETGWVFSRSVEYSSTPGQIDLGDAIMMRAGIQF